MKLFCEDRKIPCTEMYLEWDLFNTTAFVSVVTPFVDFSKKYTVDFNDIQIELVPFKTSMNENCELILILAPENYVKNLASTFGPYAGQATVKDMFSNVGLTVDCNMTSVQSEWIIPRCSFKKILERVNNFAVLSNTEGFIVSMWIDGTIRSTSMLDILNTSNTVMVEGNVISSQSSKTYQAIFPGKYSIHNSTYEGPTTDELDFASEQGLGAAHYFASSEQSKDLMERFLRNNYWRQYITAWDMVYNVTTPINLVPGMSITPSGYKLPFLCYKVRIRMNEERTIEQVIHLCRPLP